ncbi:hypothetical protein PI124_g15730 [Phytophthora idaei]|nr:hypothetical protein PI124_g15730 [Phytophthora idaei]
MQEILSAKAAVEEHGPIVVATVEGLKTHLQGKNQTARIRIRMKLLLDFRSHLRAVAANLDALRGRSCARATRENAQVPTHDPAESTQLGEIGYVALNHFRIGVVSSRREQHRGSTNYSSGEMHCLLNLIRKHIPVASAEWEAVLAQPQWKARNGASLKRKFRNMCIESKQAGTELASAMRWVQSMMTMKKREFRWMCHNRRWIRSCRTPHEMSSSYYCGWSNVPGYSQIPLTTPQ